MHTEEEALSHEKNNLIIIIAFSLDRVFLCSHAFTLKCRLWEREKYSKACIQDVKQT